VVIIISVIVTCLCQSYRYKFFLLSGRGWIPWNQRRLWCEGREGTSYKKHLDINSSNSMWFSTNINWCSPELLQLAGPQ